MGNTTSSTNTQTNLYEQYLNEQKRIIAAQQEQINNLSRMNLKNNSVQHQHKIPSNVYLQSMPIRKPQNTYSGDVRSAPLPQIEYKNPNKEKLNPYKILGITKKYDEKILKKAYLKKAMTTHPDRGGSPLEFQQVSIAYTLLLKKLNDQNNNHQHNDLRNNSKNYMSDQISNNEKNINMTDNFDINLFNKVYEENKIDTAYDRGYGEWMESSSNNKMLEQPKMFNKSFNKDLFNHEFEKYKINQQKQMGSHLVKYDEPQVDISMKGKDSLMLLGQNNVTNFSGSSDGGLGFSDYKDAFTNSCLIDTNTVNISNRDDNIKSAQRTRSNISYKMSVSDLRKQEMIKLKLEKEEQDRILRLNQHDNMAFNNYEKIHSRLINK